MSIIKNAIKKEFKIKHPFFIIRQYYLTAEVFGKTLLTFLAFDAFCSLYSGFSAPFTTPLNSGTLCAAREIFLFT